MLHASDPEYKETKLIRSGKRTLAPGLAALARWIDDKYGVKTLNLYHDFMPHAARPRLGTGIVATSTY